MIPRELERVHQEREILKKVVSSFSRESTCTSSVSNSTSRSVPRRPCAGYSQSRKVALLPGASARASQRKREDALMVVQMRQVLLSHREVYGSPRVHAALTAQAVHGARKRRARLMHAHGITPKPNRCRVVTTHSQHDTPVAPHLVQRAFTAPAPHTTWVTDIAYLPTAQGWLYLAVVLDVYSRLVVAWSMSAHGDARAGGKGFAYGSGSTVPCTGPVASE